MRRWVAAGLPPGEFWEQSAASFNAIMRGTWDAEQVEWERALFVAYHSAAFQRSEKLRSFDHYRKRMKPQKQGMTKDEFIACFQAMAARGLNVTVQ